MFLRIEKYSKRQKNFLDTRKKFLGLSTQRPTYLIGKSLRFQHNWRANIQNMRILSLFQIRNALLGPKMTIFPFASCLKAHGRRIKAAYIK